jgi:hypothetical protein
MRSTSGRVSFLVAVVLIAAAGLSASPVGSVSGTVKDASGAVVATAGLTLTNTATNAQFATTTNPQGEFQFPQLAPSTYTLVAEAQGFKKLNVPSVLVQVDQVTHVDLTVEVGSLTESVQVEAVAPLLESDKNRARFSVPFAGFARAFLQRREYRQEQCRPRLRAGLYAARGPNAVRQGRYHDPRRIPRGLRRSVQ